MVWMTMQVTPRSTHADEVSGIEEEHMGINHGSSTFYPLFVPVRIGYHNHAQRQDVLGP